MENIDFKKYYQFPLYKDDFLPFRALCSGERHMMAYDVRLKVSDELYSQLIEIINGTNIESNELNYWLNGKYEYKCNGAEIERTNKETGEIETVIIIRGWGTLTGIGGYNLPEDKAITVQDALGDYIINKLNKKRGI